MKYKPFEQGYFKYEMGLKNLDLNEWIEIDEHWKEQIALKTKLLKTQREKVLKFTPEALEASQELVETLAQHLAETFPEKFTLHEDTFHLRHEANSYDDEFTEELYTLSALDDHPLAVAAHWVQEDFCLMNTAQAEARLEAGCVCFPSRWKLIEKVGQNMAGIHSPVPDFNKNLEKPSTRFLLNTTFDKPMWRMNWTIHASNELFAYEHSSSKELLTPENILEKTFFRTERQTLRRLPKTGYVAFSIRTYMTPMNEVVKDPTDRAALLKTIESIPDEVLKYRGMADLITPLKQALSQ